MRNNVKILKKVVFGTSFYAKVIDFVTNSLILCECCLNASASSALDIIIRTF